MESKICLLNAGPTGTETLKNLVLPGCGYICVVDDAVVTERDCGNNFFVTADAVGQPRAKVTLELLTEMNSDVSGTFKQANPEDLIAQCVMRCSPATIRSARTRQMPAVRAPIHLAAPPAFCRCSEPAFFDQFSLVVATQLPLDAAAALAAHLEPRGVPLLVRVACACAAAAIRVHPCPAGCDLVSARRCLVAACLMLLPSSACSVCGRTGS